MKHILKEIYSTENAQIYNDLHPYKEDGRQLCGFMTEPDDYWSVNQMILCMGLAGSKDELDTLRKITEETLAGGPPREVIPSYTRGQLRIDFLRVPHYERILCLCFTLERLADSRAAKALEKLLDRPFIRGYAAKSGNYAGGYFFCAILEMTVARSM